MDGDIIFFLFFLVGNPNPTSTPTNRFQPYRISVLSYSPLMYSLKPVCHVVFVTIVVVSRASGRGWMDGEVDGMG